MSRSAPPTTLFGIRRGREDRSRAGQGSGHSTRTLDVIIDEVACRGLHLATLLFPSLEPTLAVSDAGWRARAAVWRDPRTVIGGS